MNTLKGDKNIRIKLLDDCSDLELETCTWRNQEAQSILQATGTVKNNVINRNCIYSGLIPLPRP